MKNKLILLTLLLVALSFACSSSNAPAVIQKNAWIPPGAQNLKYYTRGATHQLKFTADVCYPAQTFINNLVEEMKGKGWARQDTDFLNPGLKLNHQAGSGLWSHIVDEKEAYDLFRWTEDFADSPGNIVRYGLQYRVKQNAKGNDAAYQIKSCNLEVLVIYYPKEARH